MGEYLRNKNTLIFKKNETTSEIELWDGKLLVGNILYLSQPHKDFHFLITQELPKPETLFSTSLNLAKEQLVINYQLNKVLYING